MSDRERRGARPGSVATAPIRAIGRDEGSSGVDRPTVDRLAVEEPLAIRVVVEEEGRPVRHDLAITMRTPGEDEELALGFLVSEGVVRTAAQIARTTSCEAAEPPGAVVEITLVPGTPFDADDFRRNVYTSSSCGICGRAAIERVQLDCEPVADGPVVPAEVLFALPARLRAAQAVFEETGGLHAAALFAADGTLIRLREDVGRHNAVDKLVGSLLREGRLPAEGSILMVSGRASFELVQKAALAGVPILAAVGAPSSLAVELGRTVGMTVVGFLREGRGNVYCGGERVSESS